MIVFDLQCQAHTHVFEAWFSNSASFKDQQERLQISCPICGDTAIKKYIMAPNIASKGNTHTTLVPMTGGNTPPPKAMLAALAKAQAAMLENSTFVGRAFDAKARAMDAGELPKASIHGEVTLPEAKALVEDGIGVMPLPLPFVPKTALN